MGSYHIVLADDHVLIRQGLRKLIDGVSDFRVIGEAADGIELLSFLERLTPHMVILDISMPNLRGVEAAREIKMKYPDVKILILSMHKEYLHHALAAGADGYLLKEDADRELFSAIESIRQDRIFLSPRLSGEFISDESSSNEPLTAREKEVLKLIAEGKSNKETAARLFISVRTVENHRARIMSKLNLRSSADLIKYAIRQGHIHPVSV